MRRPERPGHPTARQTSRRHFLESQIASLQGDDPTGTRVKPLDKSPASAMTAAPQFGPSALTPDCFAVNTMPRSTGLPGSAIPNIRTIKT